MPMAGSDDLQLAADVKREMLTKLKVIQERLKGGFPTSRELHDLAANRWKGGEGKEIIRMSLVELTELIDILIRKA